MTKIQLRKEDGHDVLHSGGSVTYRVFDGDQWVGWVGDGRPFTGSGYGVRRWWACWREDGDTAARWNPGLRYRTRQAAVDGLTAHRAGHREPLPGPGLQTVPDDVSVLGGVECARWGQMPAVPPGEPIDPLPTIYSSVDGVEIEDTLILGLDNAEAFARRLLAAIAYERRRAAAAGTSTAVTP